MDGKPGSRTRTIRDLMSILLERVEGWPAPEPEIGSRDTDKGTITWRMEHVELELAAGTMDIQVRAELSFRYRLWLARGLGMEGNYPEEAIKWVCRELTARHEIATKRPRTREKGYEAMDLVSVAKNLQSASQQTDPTERIRNGIRFFRSAVAGENLDAEKMRAYLPAFLRLVEEQIDGKSQ